MTQQLTTHQEKFFRRALTLAVSPNPFASNIRIILATAVLALWLAGVIFTTAHHEFWRDEVRAWSIARDAASPLDLYILTRDEGHPLLWYIFLYIGKTIADTPLVLPITSIAVAFAAVTVFTFWAPFPFWFKCLFLFSALPFYAYSVVARQYGVGMLWLFASAALYPSRSRHPLRLAVILALLANTSALAVIFTGLIAAIWAWDLWHDWQTAHIQPSRAQNALAFGIVAAGILFSAFSAFPSEKTVVTPIRHSIDVSTFARAAINALTRPDITFAQMAPTIFPIALNVFVFYLAILGLARRPILLLTAFASQFVIGVFFRTVYFGGFLHQGLHLLFLVFLYWLFIASQRDERLPRTSAGFFAVGLYIALLSLVAWNDYRAYEAARGDIALPWSSSRAFGDFLKQSDRYRDAILLPEPDFYLESLPYYTPNQIYFLREHRFGKYVSFTSQSDALLSLSDLLEQAHTLQSQHRRPVLIVLGHVEVGISDSGEKAYPFNKIFAWDANELAEFTRATIQVAEFKGALTDENYRVYALR